MAIANLTLRFILELCGVAALGYWGSQAVDGPGAIALAICASLALIIVWSVVVARNADNALAQPQRDLIGTGLLLVAAGVLFAAGQPAAAVVLGAVVVVNWVLLVAFGPEAVETLVALASRHR
jgi:Protein of unknown function (DUF2568)